MAEETQVVRFIAYSDYLCPWCWNASRRLQRLEVEYQGQIEIDWRSYLLRPREKKGRDLERFRSYTLTWSRPGAESDSGPFRTWASDENPPTHSVPAHQVAKAAAYVSRDAFANSKRRGNTVRRECPRSVESIMTLRLSAHIRKNSIAGG